MKTSKAIMLAGLLLAGVCAPAAAEQDLVLGLQDSGTVQWEIAAIRALGLDDKHGINLQIRPLADSRSGQIALQAGAVDVILSDFVWVSIQRSQGNMMTMVPHSLAVGGLMVAADSDIATVADLRGKTIGVAGGPADKSWVTLQAYYGMSVGAELDGAVRARFGAPPLINQLLEVGGVDAALNFWHWNARAKAAGMVELVSVAEMFEALGLAETPPLLGWTFSETTAAEKADAIGRFLDASFEAKAALLEDDGAWVGLEEMMGAADDRALFVQLRDDYRDGIISHYGPETVAAAEQAFAVMAEFGGSDVVGDQTTLAAGTFWPDYRD